MENDIDINIAEQIANYIGPMIRNGIILNDEKIIFSMIDYYCITKIDIRIIVAKLRKYIKKGVHNSYFATLANFAENEALLVRIIDNSKEVLDQNTSFVINNQRFVPTKEEVDSVLNLFDQYEIPRFNKLIYIALYRMAKGNPILPLVTLEKEKNKSR